MPTADQMDGYQSQYWLFFGFPTSFQTCCNDFYNGGFTWFDKIQQDCQHLPVTRRQNKFYVAQSFTKISRFHPLYLLRGGAGFHLHITCTFHSPDPTNQDSSKSSEIWKPKTWEIHFTAAHCIPQGSGQVPATCPSVLLINQHPLGKIMCEA